jgi:hypothetical protein
MRHWCTKCRRRRIEEAMRCSGYSKNKIQLWKCLDCSDSLKGKMLSHSWDTKNKFQSKIINDPITKCHNWNGTIDANGYGVFSIEGFQHKAHRLAYSNHYNQELGELLVCHTCDNRRCVNPDHLFLGTIQDNMDDRNSKSRQARGERNHSKLTSEDVLAVRKMLALGVSQRRTAEIMGVSSSVVHLIFKKKLWTHV